MNTYMIEFKYFVGDEGRVTYYRFDAECAFGALTKALYQFGIDTDMSIEPVGISVIDKRYDG